MIHLRYDGRSLDVSELVLGLRGDRASDGELKARLARHLDLDDRALAAHVVDRSPSGDTIVRPPAVYG